jgi:hypothetical protein
MRLASLVALLAVQIMRDGGELAAVASAVVDTVFVQEAASLSDEFVYLYRVVIAVLFGIVSFFLRDVAHELRKQREKLGQSSERITRLEAANDWDARVNLGLGRRRTDPRPQHESDDESGEE